MLERKPFFSSGIYYIRIKIVNNYYVIKTISDEPIVIIDNPLQNIRFQKYQILVMSTRESNYIVLYCQPVRLDYSKARKAAG